jgi:hypothetical protein
MPPEMLRVMPAAEQPDRQFGRSNMFVPPEQDPGSVAAFENDGTPYEIVIIRDPKGPRSGNIQAQAGR